jgi:alpha-tubulin suppressor-like RCC1 family protein/chitodextrinase
VFLLLTNSNLKGNFGDFTSSNNKIKKKGKAITSIILAILLIFGSISNQILFSINTAFAEEQTGYVDSEAPTAPCNLIELSSTSVSVDLIWDGSTDNIGVKGYKLYRDGVEVGDTPTTEYTDKGLKSGCTYLYAVKAYDYFGNISDGSNILTITLSEDADLNSESKLLKSNINNTIKSVNSTDTVNKGFVSEGQKASILSQNITTVEPQILSTSTGAEFTLIKLSDGSVKAWGRNSYGQLGLGDTVNRNIPTLIPGLEKVKQLSAGNSYALALMNDGTVKAWGYNNNGQLGLGHNTNISSPYVIPGLSGVKQIIAGNDHSMALMNDGTVKAWGSNSKGQLGLGDTTNRNKPTTIPGVSGVVQLAAGLNVSYALMSDGTVRAWGANDYGKLGTNDTSYTYKSQPLTVPGLSRVRQIIAGYDHVFVLMEDDTVKAWGNNGQGRLGLGDTVNRISPTTIPDLAGVKQISAGRLHTIACLADGTVLSWGANPYGQLGSGDTTSRNIPTVMDGFTDVMELSSSPASQHTIAIMNNRTIRTWGYNYYGQLGLGDTANKNLPTEVPDCKYNSEPAAKVNSPVQDQVFTENDLTFTPSISIIDTDSDYVTCKYYIDNELEPREVKSTSGSAIEMMVDFLPVEISNIPDGNHVIKVELSDNFGNPVEIKTDFKVDKSGPLIKINSILSTDTLVIVNGTATDNISDLDPLPYRYTIGDEKSEWINRYSYITNKPLLPNTQYQISFEAKDKIGHVSSYSGSIYTKAVVPTIIATDVTSDTMNILISDKNPLTTQYQILVNEGQKYISESGALTDVPEWFTVSDKVKQVNGLYANTHYSFKIKAKNGDGFETSLSDPITEVTLGSSNDITPTAPKNLTCTSKSTDSIALLWEAPEDNSIVGYKIYTDGIEIGNTSSTNYTCSNLSCDTTYSYIVRSYNRQGTLSEASNEISITTDGDSDLECPSAPQNLTCSAISVTTANLSWDGSTDNAGVAGYKLYRNGIEVGTTGETAYYDTTLTQGTTYTYIVKAFDAAGNLSDSSNEIIVTSQLAADATPPTVPTNLMVTEETSQSISIIWDASTDNIGVAGYRIFRNNIPIADVNDTNYTDTDLLEGVSYTYYVIAFDEAGNASEPSNEVSVTTDREFIYPANFKALTSGSYIHVIWNAVEGAVGYELSIDGKTEIMTATEFNHSDVQMGQTYSYKIRSVYGNGTSDWSPSVSKTFSENIEINPPSISYKPKTNKIEISWTPVEQPVSYELDVDGKVINIGNSITYTHTDLMSDSTHLYRVRCVSDDFESDWSPYLLAKTNILLKPEGITSTVSASAIELKWNAVEEAEKYEVEINNKIRVLVNEPYFNNTDLFSNSIYTYRIRAVNSGGVSEWSDYIKSTTGMLEAPRNIDIAVTNTQIYISWDPVPGATFYDVYADGEIISTLSNTQFVQSGLSPATTYAYKIRALNAQGAGAWSYTYNITTALLDTPDNIRSTGSNNVVILNWNNVTSATGYDVEIDGTTVVSVSSNKYNGSGGPSTSHTYRIRSKNSNGMSAWSEPKTQIVPNQNNEIKGEWKQNGTIQKNRYLAGSTQLNGKIYLIGGYAGSSRSAINEEYDPLTDTWTIKTSMSTIRYALGVANVNGKIYAIGGYDGSNYLATVEEYDPNTDTWITKTNMPTGRAYFGIAAVNGKIYIVGGYNKSGYLNIVEEYDPVTDTWTTRANMLNARRGLGLAELNGKIYALAGYNGEYINSIEEYDPILNQWIEKGVLQSARQSVGVAVSNQRLFIIGGQSSSSTETIVEEYDPVRNVFLRLNSMPNDRYQFSLEAVGDSLYAIGGSGTSSNIIQRFILSSQTNMPLVPTNVYASMSSNTISLFWDIDQSATGYDIEIDGVKIVSVTTNTYKHSSVTLGAPHTYRIRAKNIVGVGEWSNEISIMNPDVKYTADIIPLMLGNNTPVPYIIQGSNLNSINAFKAFDNSTTASNSWSVNETAPAGGHYLIIDFGSGNEKTITKITLNSQLKSGTDYGIKNWEIWASYDGADYTKLTQGVQSNSSSKQEYIFDNSNEYQYYRLNVLNSYNDNTGQSIGVAEIELMSPQDISVGLATPTVSVDSIAKNTICLSWPSVPGATGYDIDCDGSIISTSGAYYIHSSLLPGTKHKYRIRAKSSTQVSNWSDFITRYTILGPVYIQSKTSTSTTITVQWNPVPDAVAYEIKVDGKVYDNGLSTTFIHTGLIPSTSHTYSVKVRTPYSYSDYEYTLTWYSTPSNVPVNVTAKNISGTSITITWPAVAGASYYDVKVDDLIFTVNSEFTYKELVPNKEYTFRVRSRNSGGASEWSQEYKFSTLKNNGTLEDPYLIYTREDLSSINNNLSGYYKVMSDIDLGNMEWTPIGIENNPFMGQLDGNGYSITNITINQPNSDNIGMFSYIGANAYLKNLKLIVGDKGIIGGNSVGGLAGYCKPGSNITNCSVDGPGYISGNSNIGGVVGVFIGKNMLKCSSHINVIATGTGAAGGLIGSTTSILENTNSNISECYSTGNITNIDGYAGGLIGEYTRLPNNYSNNIKINICYATGYIKAKYGFGLAGFSSTNIDVHIKGKFIIENCFSTCNIEVEAPAVPIFGHQTCINDTETYSHYTMNNCYFAGKGFITKYGFGSDFISSNNFINSKLINSMISDGTAKTNTDMKYKVTYIDWDFNNIWDIDEGNSFPYLKALPKPDSVVVEDKSEFAGGKGSKEDPLLISTEEQLYNIKYSPTACFKLTNNISLTKEWTPIGDDGDHPFMGILDGNGYKITNLTINKQSGYGVGFFAFIGGYNTCIKNLTLNINQDGIAGYTYVGALVGFSEIGVSIENCHVEGYGTVSGNNFVGGLVGIFNGKSISGCSSSANVTCTATGTGNAYAGGLVGSTAFAINNGISNSSPSDSNSIIANCYSTGNVTNINGVAAGLIGNSVNVYISNNSNNSYSNTVVISESYATGHIKGITVYGLAGLCKADISYQEDKYGKLTIKNCYSTCLLDGTNAFPLSSYDLDGFFPHTIYPVCQFNISNSYFAGQMNATNKYGIGIPYSDSVSCSASFSNNYIDYSLNPIDIANDSGIKKTTAELMQQATFNKWDFTNIWAINEGSTYPFLKNMINALGISISDVTNNSVSIFWNSVDGADGYELEIDGTVRDELLIEPTFVHSGLQPNTVHTYRFRTHKQGVTSEWCPLLSVTTLAVFMPTPQNVVATYSSEQITICWDAVPEAKEYEIEVDGKVINVGTALNYVHKNFADISQHAYRVRAKNSLAISKWSNIASAISWSETNPAVCLVENNWLTPETSSDDIEVIVKANNITSMYTVLLELEYNPSELDINKDSVKELIWEQDSKTYFEYTIDETNGKLKVLISGIAEEQGKSGLIDLVSLKLKLNKVESSNLKVKKAVIVDNSVNYIQTPEVKDLNIHIIKE